MRWVTSSDGGSIRVIASALAGAVALVGCALPVSSVRFENRPPVWRVEDTRPIARPAAREASHNAEEMRDARAPLLHVLGVPGAVRARAVNSLDEVPDSSWFVNRIGRHALDPEAIARGPGDGRGPVPPIVVKSTKEGGHGIGVRIEDALGTTYLWKFDGLGSPEVETANGPVVQRLLWAAGYHVPEDGVLLVRRSDVVVAPDATRTLDDGSEVPMREEDFEALLARTAQPGGGLLRGLASRLLEGSPLGGAPVSGVRPDDPNDRVPHELRRDVRGQHAFFAWLGHTDAKVDNTLDLWVPRAEGAEVGHVVHYLVDFGLALGAKDRHGARPHDGFAYDFDLGWGVASIGTLGILRRPWERLDPADATPFGRYEVDTFDPARFRTTRPYVPFLYVDRFDGYWASKILVRFDRAHVEAAVARGRFSDRARSAHLVDVILGRRDRIVRRWFDEVAPIDQFEVVSPVERGARATVCAVDLAILHGFVGEPDATRYRVEHFDYDGARLGGARDVAARADGRLCVLTPAAPARRGGYLMVRVTVRRGERTLPAVIAHLAPSPGTRALRLIGVEHR